MEYTIRPACVKDADDINEMRRMPGVMENICTLPSEPVSETVQNLEQAGPNAHQFVAVTVLPDGTEKAVGYARLVVETCWRLRHGSFVFLMVHTRYQRRGIGEKLMSALLDLADNWLRLVRLELVVLTGNEGAVRFFEKMGFEKEGVKRKAVVRYGEYEDEFVMSRIRVKTVS